MFIKKSIDRSKIITNANIVFHDDIAVSIWALTFWIILYLWLEFNDFDNMIGNLWAVISYAQIISHVLLALFFWLFIAATIYKIRYMNQFHSSSTSSGIIGGLLSAVVIWCPACSIGLASYLGLSTFLVSLPRFGLEIKLLGLIIVIWVSYYTLKNLFVCKVKKS